MIPHRLQRTLRRHLALLDFLLRAAVSHRNWAHPELLENVQAARKGQSLWFERKSG